MLLGDGRQRLGHNAGTLGVEVDQDVVHHQRQGDRSPGELRRKPEADTEIQLLGRAPAQGVERAGAPVPVENDEVAVTLEESRLLPAGDVVEQP